MNRKRIKIESVKHWHELRDQDLTSTAVSALFKINPYMTEYELFHEKKKGLKKDFKETERMIWGNRLESVIAEGICHDNEWKGQPFKDYIRLPEYRLGSSFDWLINDGDGEAILEIKNVDSFVFMNTWNVDGETVIEAPPHIEMQVQHQMLVSGIDRAYIGVFSGGNKTYVLKRKKSEAIQSKILEKAAAFWANDNEPKPDYAKDFELMKIINSYAEPGKEIQASSEINELVAEHKKVYAQYKALDKKISEIKGKIFEKIGDAWKVKGENFSISAGVIPEKVVKRSEYVKKSYRNFRINYSRKKT